MSQNLKNFPTRPVSSQTQYGTGLTILLYLLRLLEIWVRMTGQYRTDVLSPPFEVLPSLPLGTIKEMVWSLSHTNISGCQRFSLPNLRVSSCRCPDLRKGFRGTLQRCTTKGLYCKDLFSGRERGRGKIFSRFSCPREVQGVEIPSGYNVVSGINSFSWTREAGYTRIIPLQLPVQSYQEMSVTIVPPPSTNSITYLEKKS